MSKRSRKLKKKKLSVGTESGDKPTGDHPCIQNEAGISIDIQLAENQSLPKESLIAENQSLPKESLPNANSTEQDVVPDDNEHEKVEEDMNSKVGLEPKENPTPDDPNDDTLDGIGDDSSEDEQLNATSEVDFKVSTLISAFANHSIIQKLCWLLKFYKSNSLAINHYIISMLRRISDDLELHPMLYQVKSEKCFTV